MTFMEKFTKTVLTLCQLLHFHWCQLFALIYYMLFSIDLKAVLTFLCQKTTTKNGMSFIGGMYV